MRLQKFVDTGRVGTGFVKLIRLYIERNVVTIKASKIIYFSSHEQMMVQEGPKRL